MVRVQSTPNFFEKEFFWIFSPDLNIHIYFLSSHFNNQEHRFSFKNLRVPHTRNIIYDSHNKASSLPLDHTNPKPKSYPLLPLPNHLTVEMNDGDHISGMGDERMNGMDGNMGMAPLSGVFYHSHVMMHMNFFWENIPRFCSTIGRDITNLAFTPLPQFPIPSNKEILK